MMHAKSPIGSFHALRATVNRYSGHAAMRPTTSLTDGTFEMRNRPLFSDQAWQYGPVVPEVYNAFQKTRFDQFLHTKCLFLQKKIFWDRFMTSMAS
jgi:hypothetical protein